jgi:hypothetical protein
VRWRGSADLSQFRGKHIAVRFQCSRAQLFSVVV